MTYSPRALALALLALAACSDAADEAEPVAPTAQVTDADPIGERSEAPQGVPSEDVATLPEPEGSLAAGEMALGAEDAPLTVTEYASVTCPACAAFHATHFEAIREELIEPGLVRFVYREFPTNPVALSYAGSILARCAATEAGAPAYFALNGALFERQGEWVYGNDPRSALENIFAQVGMDNAAMQACLRRPALKTAIDENIERGREAGVTGTPTLFVDGEPFDVRRPTEEVVAELRQRAEAAGD